jgi:transcriptional regulator
MYLPRHFEQPDEAELKRLVTEHPLGLVIVVDANGRPTADPIPLEWAEEAGTVRLRGHVARANPLWQGAAGREVLVVFQGPQGYVSPNAYPSKAEHHKVVPTWNYAVAQARGRLVVHEAGSPWLHALVARLTAHHEARHPAPGASAPWAVSDAPADYVAKMLEAIVGIEIEVSEWRGKWKLSQNRGEADRTGVIESQRARGDAQLATWTDRAQPRSN